MEYIDKEDFLRQDENVQRVFKEYFDGELMLFWNNEQLIYGEFEDILINTPTITEGLIRKFIEDKICCKFNVGNTSKIINSYKKELDIEYETDLFKFYWKVACEIAKEN